MIALPFRLKPFSCRRLCRCSSAIPGLRRDETAGCRGGCKMDSNITWKESLRIKVAHEVYRCIGPRIAHLCANASYSLLSCGLYHAPVAKKRGTQEQLQGAQMYSLLGCDEPDDDHRRVAAGRHREKTLVGLHEVRSQDRWGRGWAAELAKTIRHIQPPARRIPRPNAGSGMVLSRTAWGEQAKVLYVCG